MGKVTPIRPETAGAIVEQLQRVRDNADRRPPDGGGGGSNLEARVAKLESTVEHIQRDIAELKADVRGIRADMRTDFRLTFGALIATALGLAGLMAKGFGWL